MTKEQTLHHHNSNPTKNIPPTLYKKGAFPETFMTAEMAIQECGILIDNMLNRCSTQEDFDQTNKQLCKGISHRDGQNS